ncbi:MAG: Flp pilus assembly complex ATPase component TadA, partial [Kiritimatiellae bacterium]|nr:Flp pilus assembly complex ATPase component TadA [Kiritimatiellia bacterium]
TESFSKALRAALREDPDIVLVGEMRDLETIEIALETAETGHLVFGTVHTNSAAATIDRIIDKFPSDRQNQIRTLLGDTLQGVVAQTLCKKIGGGRVAAFEILIVNTPVAAHIREGKTFLIPSVMQTSKALGMQTFCDDLTNLVLRGKITCEEAYIKAVNKEEMRVTMENAGLPLDFLKIEKSDSGRAGRIAEMVSQLQAALRTSPDDPGTLNDLAWILAASPVESFRDGKTAFKLAERLSKIEGETIQSLDALGTAYAAIGNYKMAAERLERALAMAKAEKIDELIGPLTMRMNFFKKGRVYADETIGSDR